MVEDGLGAAHREDFPLGCDGSARDSNGVSAKAFACTCRDGSCEAIVN